MSQNTNHPPYIRIPLILLGLCLIIGLLYVGQNVLFPLLLALLIAILLRPVVNLFYKRLRFPYFLASAITVLLSVIIIAAVVLFVSWQIGEIANDWNKIKANIHTHYHHIQQWIKQSFKVSYFDQDKYIEKATRNSFNNGSSMVGNTLSTFTDVVMNLVLIPIYAFLILLYRDLFIGFLYKLIKKEHHDKLLDILIHVKIAIQSYLTGLLTEMVIVASLTSVGYMIIGVQYALLLGVITGILNLIPYVGIMVAGGLSIVATLTSSTDLSIIFSVLTVNIIVQFIDNNFLVPLIVSSKVKINALVSLISIIVGGAIAGISGMFLALPIIAILKVIFDRVDFLEPFGFVMGDNLPHPRGLGKMKLPAFHKKSSVDKTEKGK